MNRAHRNGDVLPGVTFRAAIGSRLTLRDVMKDPPALPPRDIADFPDVGDGVAHAARNLGRYVQALEQVAEVARKQGDVRLRSKVLVSLARFAVKHNNVAGRGEASTPAVPDFSGLSDDELRRLSGRPCTEDRRATECCRQSEPGRYRRVARRSRNSSTATCGM